MSPWGSVETVQADDRCAQQIKYVISAVVVRQGLPAAAQQVPHWPGKQGVTRYVTLGIVGQSPLEDVNHLFRLVPKHDSRQDFDLLLAVSPPTNHRPGAHPLQGVLDAVKAALCEGTHRVDRHGCYTHARKDALQDAVSVVGADPENKL